MSSKLCTKKLNSVVKGIQRLYPVALADSSWDNTGLLVDSSHPNGEQEDGATTKILLTVDLTQSVVDEAINLKTNLILAYHPFIFRGLKSITHSDPQQSSLIKLIQNNISVYSPHTAIDAAVGGVNDWLADGVSDKGDTREVIEPSDVLEGAGMGRIVTLNKSKTIEEIISDVKTSIGQPFIQVAKPRHDRQIKTIAICAGSGSGVFRKVKADLYYTGELSHHETLYLKESGSYVIACNHSNTERGFLKHLAKQLTNELGDVEISISETDKDPFETV